MQQKNMLKTLNRMSKIPTAEKFLYNNAKDDEKVIYKDSQDTSETAITYEGASRLMIEFAKLHVQEALESVVQKVQLDEYQIDEDENGFRTISEINVESILNAYPLENIK